VTRAKIKALTKKSKRPGKPKSTPGPKPETLKIKGGWKETIKKSFTKKKPADGWPE
jgi:hypothetical protein